MPASRRDPSELVSEARISHQRPALRSAIPREEREEVDDAREPDDEPVVRPKGADQDDDPASTPRAADGGIALASVPRLVAPAHKLVGLPLDHKAGFVLACIDGESNVQTLIDVSGLAPMEVVQTLARLVELGVVVI